ncbi:MAG TPA: DUF2806 domain-containing protein [Moraxellaceae bacterium]|nr:DUF2806 domain-containing protein [Moraxellaceae bacterium]
MTTDPSSLRQKLADKLWQTLFGGGDSALLPPWRQRSDKRSTAEVRSAELSAIEGMLADLDGLHTGRKVFNPKGEVVDAPQDDFSSSIRFNPLIEQAEEDPLAALKVPTVQEALQKVRLEAEIQSLRLSLNVRRIGLKADQLVETVELETMSDRPVDPDWLMRWKESAARAVANDFQEMWARVLVDEVRQPGSHNLRTIAFLNTVSKADMTTLRFMMRLDLGGFISLEAAGYFNKDIHGPMFTQMEAMGLLQPDPGKVRIKSVEEKNFRAVLRCQNKALYIEGPDEGSELQLLARPFTALGREISSLFNTGMADTAYLFALGNALKKRGYHIDIGDWLGRAGDKGLFSEKMSL